MAARGHFEAGPRMEYPHGLTAETSAEPGRPTYEFGWRFVDEDGRVLATCTEDFDDLPSAKAAAGALVLAVRAATYGQRFEPEIADAVVEVDEV